jgi:hypothetical protein
MMLIPDLPGANAIKVGRLYHKPGSVYDTLTRCCRMVFHEADDPSLPLGRAGSATLIRFCNTNYVIMTRHELRIRFGGKPPRDILETVRISSGKGQLTNIPIQRCKYEFSNLDQEYHDILVFQAADAWDTQSTDAPYFSPLAPFSRADRAKSFMVGYPTVDGVMDEYLENFTPNSAGTIHIKRSIGDCDIDSGFASNARYFKRYLHSHPQRVVDSYSGGAVFSLIGQLENLEIVLDGIIVRGGSQHIYIVDVDYLVKAIADPGR